MSEYRLPLGSNDDKRVYFLLMDSAKIDGKGSLSRANAEFKRRVLAGAASSTEDADDTVDTIRSKMLQEALSQLWPGAIFELNPTKDMLSAEIVFSSDEEAIQFKLIYL